MRLFKCLVPVLVLLLVEHSSARPAVEYAKDNYYYYYPPTGQQATLIVQDGASQVNGNANVTNIGTFNWGSPGVTGNGQGNGHPDGETTAATAVSQSGVNPFLSQPGQWSLGPFVAANAGGGAGPSTFRGYGPAYDSRVLGANSQSIAISNTGSSGVGGYSVGNGNAAANAEATATANSERTSGSTGKIDAQNLLHVGGPQAPGVNGNGQGNGHPDGETTAATAVSQSGVNPFLSQPGQWILGPFVAANTGGGAGPSTFGGYGPAYDSRVLGANSQSNAVANAGSSGVGGSSVGNGNAATNAEATATANSETTSGSTADAVSNANRQGSSGGLSRAISTAYSNASAGSTSSSSKSTANGSGVKSSAFSYASASAGANV